MGPFGRNATVASETLGRLFRSRSAAVLLRKPGGVFEGLVAGARCALLERRPPLCAMAIRRSPLSAKARMKNL